MLVSLIQSIDTMMVGRLGTTTISAVSLPGQPRLIILMPVMAMNVGIMALVGRCKGAQDREAANRCLRTGVVISFWMTTALAAVAMAFARELMLFCGATEETLVDAVAYLRITSVGVVFHAVSLTVSAGQRGVGNTKLSLAMNVSANLVNIVLNYCLIEGHLGFPGLGVRGAAIATSICNVTAFGIALFSVSRSGGYLFLGRRGGYARLEERKLLWNLSTGSIMERIGIRVGLLLFAKIVAGLGTTPFAIYNICARLYYLSFCIGDGFGTAACTLVAQNLGAKKREDAVLYGRIALTISAGAGICFFIGAIVLRYWMASLYSADQAVIQACGSGIIIMACIGFLQIPQVLMAGTLRGGGDTHYLGRVVLFCTMIVRPGVAYLLILLGFGLNGAFLGILAEIALRFIFSLIRFLQMKWIYSFDCMTGGEAESCG